MNLHQRKAILPAFPLQLASKACQRRKRLEDAVSFYQRFRGDFLLPPAFGISSAGSILRFSATAFHIHRSLAFQSAWNSFSHS